MKKQLKKLALDRTTLRSLSENQMNVAGGEQGISVGTCSACRPTYNPTEGFSCRGVCA